MKWSVEQRPVQSRYSGDPHDKRVAKGRGPIGVGDDDVLVITVETGGCFESEPNMLPGCVALHAISNRSVSAPSSGAERLIESQRGPVSAGPELIARATEGVNQLANAFRRGRELALVSVMDHFAPSGAYALELDASL